MREGFHRDEHVSCRAAHTLYTTVVHQPLDTAKVGVLSFVYTIQNNLFYLAASHLDAATFMV